MRITHLVVSPQFHGTERYVVDVASGLAARGHDVTVVGGDPAVMASLLPPTVRRRPGHDGRSALASLVGAGRQDVVHAHLLRSERIATLAAPATRARPVVTEHLARIEPSGALGRAQERLLSRTSRQRIAVSHAIADGLHRHRRRASVLHNGVTSVPSLRTSPPSGSRTAFAPTVLVGQRLHHSKDTATALRAWALSGLADDGWRLQVAGEGPQRQALDALVADLGVRGSVDMLGWRSDLHSLMATSDVFLASAVVEPLGLSVLEAMARALPVVASTATGHLETVGSVPGARLFTAGDAEACAGQLRALASDAEGRRRYGDELRTVQRASFDVEHHLDALEDLYTKGKP